jgi:hypothetical protein
MLRAGVNYLHWPTAPDWALQGVADFLAWAHTNHGVPLVGPPMWLAYGADSRRPGVTPAAYGASPARMTGAQWTAFKGICGHSHVPENVHGDPGALPFTKLLAMATTTPQETDMPLTDADVTKIWAHTAPSPTAAAGTNPDRSMETFARYGDARHAQVMAQLGALTGLVTVLTTAVTAGGGLTEAQATAAAEAGARAALAELGDALND